MPARISSTLDYATWKEYALKQGIHNAVTTYLDMKKNDFYRVETNVGGKSYVTARGEGASVSDTQLISSRNKIPSSIPDCSITS